MKVANLFSRCVAFSSLAIFSPLAVAQTCVAGVQASNPASVYVIDSANGTVTDSRTGLKWDRCARGVIRCQLCHRQRQHLHLAGLAQRSSQHRHLQRLQRLAAAQPERAAQFG